MASKKLLILLPFSIFLALLSPASATSRGLLRAPAPPKPPTGLCSAAAINKQGYKCQEFNVTTEDGYQLSVQRIPVGRAGGGGKKKRQPVFLQHGILMDGMTWVAGPPKESLAMILADKGFDVWISNIRGTRFSRRHRDLKPSDPKFWDWSWDELIAKDVPAVTNLIFQRTKRRPHYVGHSMGTLLALASLSEGRMKNVKSAALLSPIAFLSNLQTPLTVAAAKAFLGEIGSMFGFAEFIPGGNDAIGFIKEICNRTGINYDDLQMTALTGQNCCLNTSTIRNFIKKQPQPTSSKNLVHFSQTIRQGFPSKYDYGNAIANMQRYGKIKPPIYDLSKIPRDFPLFIAHGGQDALSDAKDVATLLEKIKSHDKEKLKVVFIENYAHLDFVMGMNAKDILYNKIVDFFRKHN